MLLGWVKAGSAPKVPTVKAPLRCQLRPISLEDKLPGFHVATPSKPQRL